MSGNNGGGDKKIVPTRVDLSGARLASFRSIDAASTSQAQGRRPKFVPKAAKRRSQGEAGGSGDGPARSFSGDRERGGRFGGGRGGDRDRDRGGRGRGDGGGRDGGRGGRGRGRGRGQGSMPTGRVTFVGTLAGGSGFSASGPAPRPAKPVTSNTAADGVGISVLEDNVATQLEDMELDSLQQWPPEVKDEMEPMCLPFVRQPEPERAAQVFTDETGQVVLPDDSLLFFQLPTTLPLQKAKREKPKQDKDISTDQQEDEDQNMDQDESEDSKTKRNSKKESSSTKESNSNSKKPSKDNDQEQVYDDSLMTAPGGFIGKLCIHKSGRTVLVLGDKQFDVACAQTPSFCEDVYSIDPKEKQCVVLGKVARHLVVTPDFDALLAP